MYNDYLYHHGILGQKWGIRNYQNSDGTLTEAGKARYAKLSRKEEKIKSKISKNQDKLNKFNLTKKAKMATYESLAAKNQLKAYNNSHGLFKNTSLNKYKTAKAQDLANKYSSRFNSLYAKEYKLKANIEKGYAQLNKIKNKKIDMTAINTGKRYLFNS